MKVFKIGEFILLVLLVASDFVIAGCNGDGDDNGSRGPADITGTWTGTGPDGSGAIFDLILYLTQSGSEITGTYQATEMYETWTNVLAGTYSDGSGVIDLYHRDRVDLTLTLEFEENTAGGTLYSPHRGTSGEITFTKTE